MKLIVLVGSPSVQKYQDAKSRECECPSSESVRCNINSHQGSIKGGKLLPQNVQLPPQNLFQ